MSTKTFVCADTVTFDFDINLKGAQKKKKMSTNHFYILLRFRGEGKGMEKKKEHVDYVNYTSPVVFSLTKYRRRRSLRVDFIPADFLRYTVI